MRYSKFFIALCFLIFCSLLAKSQDSDYVYKDSSIILADSIATRGLVVEMKKNNSINENTVFDTLLKNSQLSIIRDSAEALKNSVSFAYAKNLDSILIDLQKKQRMRGVPDEANNSWLERIFFSAITKIFFWVLACLFVGFILYKLFFTEGFFQRQTVKSNLIVLQEEDGHSLATTDYNKLISQSVANKNYRLAIRYHYLQVLQKLFAKGAIQFAADKTNSQYTKELADSPYKDAFVSVTKIYEYMWYGGFDMDEIKYNKIQNNFKKFISQI